MLSPFHWRAIARKLHAGSLALSALLLCACGAAGAQTVNSPLQARVALPDNHQALAGYLGNAKFLGHQSPATPVKIGFVLPLRNQNLLTQLDSDLYNPLSPNYHQFLTPQQFANTFGPTVDDYNAVIAYAQSAGFTIVDTSITRDLLVVSGSTQTVENAFRVHLNRYLMENGHVAFCNDVAPTAPQDVAARIVGITGLNSLVPRHHHMRIEKTLDKLLRPIGREAHLGNGPAGGLAPADVKSVYKLSVPYTGVGQSVALFETDGFEFADVEAFARQYRLPTPNIITIPVDGFNGDVETTDGETEDVLDIDMVLSLVPNATIYVYEVDGAANSATDVTDAYQKIADDDKAQVVSTSIGAPEAVLSTTELTDESNAFVEMRTNGQSMLAASGDSGAYDDAPLLAPKTPTLSVDDPASQEDVTGVGGTTLTAIPGTTGLSYDGEVVWQGTMAGAAFSLGGSGGGVSTNTVEPDYQMNAGITATSSTLGAATAATGTTAAASSTTSTGGPPGGIEAAPRASSSSSSSTSSSSTSSTSSASTSTGGSLCPNPGPTTAGVTSAFRQVPDVALNADPETGYDIYVADEGGWTTIGGTSAAAPLWAGFTALVNQNRSALNPGASPIGFLNPPIYAIGANSTAYAAAFNDIVCGNNLHYVAAVGYDDCTGWGSFIGNALLVTLTSGSQGTVTGTVTDASGKPISGATITVRVANSGFVVDTTTTDSTGNYSVSGTAGNYLISADDDLYAGETSEVTISGSAQALTVNFVLVVGASYSPGLQMISAPYEYSGIADFSTLFGIADDPPIGPPNGSDPTLYYWAPALRTYIFTPTSPADTLHLGYGYWVDFPAEAYLHRQGTTAMTGQAFRINLNPGWNMIGNPFAGSVAISSISVDTVTPGTPVAITSSANTSVSLPLYTYGPTDTNYEIVDKTGSLTAYQGYWVYAFNACALVVPPPGGTTAPPPPPI